jgi:chorismate synthase
MLRFLTAGESHGATLLAILEGMPAGLSLSSQDLTPDLKRRQQGLGAGPRMKKIEKDQAEILTGILAGNTTGAPIALAIPNRDHERWKGREIEPTVIPRPGHADLTAAVKYGYPDLRFSSERASARETAARVAVGSICRKFLEQFDIEVGSYVVQIGAVLADLQKTALSERFHRASENSVRCPDLDAAERMEQEIRTAMQARDTLGGVFEVLSLGVPIGLGSHTHWDRKLSTRLSAAVMSIPAIKGVEIGEGFGYAKLQGTNAHDAIHVEKGDLTRPTNRAGGLEGGISNGQPIVLRAVMKPLSSTLTPQSSVNLAEGIPAETHYERSDYCAVPRAAVVAEAVVCLVLADALIQKLGGDSLTEMRTRFNTIKNGTMTKLELDNEPIRFWE